MRNRLLFIYFLVCFNGLTNAQTNDVKMQNIAAAGNYYEAKELYDCLKSWGVALSPLSSLLYEVNMAVYQNRPDSIVGYLEKILEQVQSFDFYHKLWNLYVQLHDYPKAFSTCDRAKSYLKENPDNICEGTLQEWADYVVGWENRTRQLENAPVLKILRDKSVDSISIIIEDNENLLPYNEVVYNNGNKIKTIFDSGIPDYFYMDKGVAKQIGVRKYSDDNDTLKIVNGVVVSGYTGILDSVQIANVNLYNIPVNVIDMDALVNASDSVSIYSVQRESFKCHYDTAKILLGIKTMTLIGNFIWDFENKILRFPFDENKIENSKEANLFMFDNKLYTRINVNNIPVTVLVDTGDFESMKLDSWFYEKNKKDMPIDTSAAKWYLSDIVMIHHIRHNVSRKLVYNPVVTFENKRMNSNVQVWVQSLIDGRELDNPDLIEGTVGYPFLRNLGKQIQIDFRNMRMDVLK